MIKKMRWPLTSLLLLLIGGCLPPPIKGEILQRQDDFGRESLQNSRIAILVVDDFRYSGFTRTFDKNFNSTEAFGHFLGNTLEQALAGYVGSVVQLGVIGRMEARPYVSALHGVQALEKLPHGTDPETNEPFDHLLIVTSWFLGDDHEFGTFPTMPAPGGGMTGGGSSKVPFAVFIANASIFNNKGQIAFSGRSKGRKGVEFFQYSSAMTRAVTEACTNLTQLMAGDMPLANIGMVGE